MSWLRDHVKSRSTARIQYIPNVVAASTEWARGYRTGLDIDRWVRATLARKSAVLGSQAYQFVVVPGQTCGKITARIVAIALQDSSLAVRALVRGPEGAPMLAPVTAITAHDPEDWTAGWTLTLKETP
jgi:hypothetical protein